MIFLQSDKYVICWAFHHSTPEKMHLEHFGKVFLIKFADKITVDAHRKQFHLHKYRQHSQYYDDLLIITINVQMFKHVFRHQFFNELNN